MEKIDFVSLYRKSTFAIVYGPYKGKFMQIMSIDYPTDSVESMGETRLPVAVIKPVLRTIAQSTNWEAMQIYQIYHGHNSELIPTVHDIKNIIEGNDWVQGDFMQVHDIIQFCVSRNIDVLNGIEKGFAIKHT